MKTRTKNLRSQRALAIAISVIMLTMPVIARPSNPPVTTAPTESTIVLQTTGAPLLPGTRQVVSAVPGNEWNPRVECDAATYTYDNFQGVSTIHYQDLSTGADSVIPGNEVDLLADISGSRVVFTEVTFTGDTVRIFDTISQTTTVIPGLWLMNPSIGGNLVAFQDFGSRVFQIGTYDLSSGTVTNLTNDASYNLNPKVSPDGGSIIWSKCSPAAEACDIYSATQTSPGVFTTRALTDGNRQSTYDTSTNGEVAVYISNRTGDRDIYYQPLTGGTEVHLSIPGAQWNPRISGDLISFEQIDQLRREIFVYDIRSEIVYRVTNPSDSESWSDINVCGDTGRILYHTLGEDAFDIYGFTFQVPSLPSDAEDQLDDLIALIRGLNLPPGISNSLITKLQHAIDAINASDTATACSLLTAFTNECRAQSGKKLTAAQSAQLINSANQIKTSLGCP